MKASGIIEIDLEEYHTWLIEHSGIKSLSCFDFGVPRVSNNQFEVNFDCDDSGTLPKGWIGDTEVKKQWREYKNKAEEPQTDKYNLFRTQDFLDLNDLSEQLIDCGFRAYGRIIYEKDGKECKLSLATGGWSDNEEIIRALMDNHLFWAKYWESSHRGGLYIFTQEIKE